MLRSPLGPAPMPLRPKALHERLAFGQLRRFRAVDPEIHEVIIGVQSHVAIGIEAGRDRSANARIIGRGLHGPGGNVGKKFVEVNLENLPWSAKPASSAASASTTRWRVRRFTRNRSAGRAFCGAGRRSWSPASVATAATRQDIELHCFIAGAQHPHEAGFRDLHNQARFLVDRERLRAAFAVAPENQPLPIRRPLPVRLVNLRLRVTTVGAGQEFKRQSRDRIGNDLLFRRPGSAHLPKQGGRGKQYEGGEASCGFECCGVHWRFLSLQVDGLWFHIFGNGGGILATTVVEVKQELTAKLADWNGIDKPVPKWHHVVMEQVLEEPRKRITARVSDGVRDTLEQAAELLGATVNQFVVQTAYRGSAARD